MASDQILMTASRKPSGGYNIVIPKTLANAMGWSDKSIPLNGELVVVLRNGKRYLGLLIYRKSEMQEGGNGVWTVTGSNIEVFR